MQLEVLTSQYVRFATEGNWFLRDCLLCDLLRYLTKLPLFTNPMLFLWMSNWRLLPGSKCSGKWTSLTENHASTRASDITNIGMDLCWNVCNNSTSSSSSNMQQKTNTGKRKAISSRNSRTQLLLPEKNKRNAKTNCVRAQLRINYRNAAFVTLQQNQHPSWFGQFWHAKVIAGIWEFWQKV